MILIKYIIWLWLVSNSLCCINKDYSNERDEADTKGIPSDSLQSYFSTYEPFDSSQIVLLKDSFLIDYVSSSLYAFREPVWHNNNFDKDQYRLLWLPSLEPYPVIFILSKEKDVVSITTKTLDRHPLTQDVRYKHGHQWDQDYLAQGHELIIENDTLADGQIRKMTLVKGRFAKIKSNQKRLLTNRDWQYFNKLIGEADFMNMQTFVEHDSMDQDFCSIEANTKQGYKLVFRNRPEPKLIKICEFLANKSGMNISFY